jgi:hypothetical protein
MHKLLKFLGNENKISVGKHLRVIDGDKMILKEILRKESLLVMMWTVFKWMTICFLNTTMKRLAPKNQGFLYQLRRVAWKTMHHRIRHRPISKHIFIINIYISRTELL